VRRWKLSETDPIFVGVNISILKGDQHFEIVERVKINQREIMQANKNQCITLFVLD